MKDALYIAEVFDQYLVRGIDKSGKGYIAVEFMCNSPRKVKARVFLSFGSGVSWRERKAQAAWRMVTAPQSPMPTSLEEAEKLYEEFRVEADYIQIDHTGKFPEILKVFAKVNSQWNSSVPPF
jgi:hypothetical protein